VLKINHNPKTIYLPNAAAAHKLCEDKLKKIRNRKEACTTNIRILKE